MPRVSYPPALWGAARHGLHTVPPGSEDPRDLRGGQPPAALCTLKRAVHSPPAGATGGSSSVCACASCMHAAVPALPRAWQYLTRHAPQPRGQHPHQKQPAYRHSSSVLAAPSISVVVVICVRHAGCWRRRVWPLAQAALRQLPPAAKSSTAAAAVYPCDTSSRPARAAARARRRRHTLCVATPRPRGHCVRVIRWQLCCARAEAPTRQLEPAPELPSHSRAWQKPLCSLSFARVAKGLFALLLSHTYSLGGAV